MCLGAWIQASAQCVTIAVTQRLISLLGLLSLSIHGL